MTTYYATVADAVANAGTGVGTTNTITMLKASTESTVTVGKTVILDMHGCVLKGTGSGSVISVSSNGNLTVTDSKPNSEHHFNKDSTPWVWDSTENSGDVVKGGCITGGSADSGGGVYVNGGTLNMTGGNIVGNKATLDNSNYGGGGVCLNGGTFTMSGNALVVGNQSPRGGGVRVNQGTFTMTGGSITGNTAQYSGGVYLGQDDQISVKFEMSGGSISNNTGTGSGGGVGVNNSAVFEMSGGSITNNTAPTGGGVLVMRISTFNMSGNAIIEGNEATGTAESNGGGGVRVLGSATFSMSDTASIINNTSTWGGGGVYVESGTFEMKGNALVVGNSAASGGGVRVDDGTFNVSGSPKITGNMDKASTPKANNVYLATGKYITIKGNFNGEISIYTASTPSGQFGTADDASYTGAAHFISDYIRTDEGHSGEHYVGVQDTSVATKWVWKSNSTKIYTITVGTISHGAITPSAASAAEGVSIHLTVTPNPGYIVKPDSTPTFTVTKEGGTGTVTVSDNTFTMPACNVTVTGTAEFKAIEYTVTLNPLGGTGGSGSVTATYDATMPSITPPTKTGYSFAGYFDATSGGKKYYNADGTSANTWDKASDTTLYAQWTPKQTTVTLNNKGGTGVTESVTAIYDAAMPSITPPTKTYYTFEGYYDSDAATDGTKYYNADGTSERTWDKEEEKAILYAHWTGDKYSVTFDKNTGTTEADPKTIDETYGTYYIFPTTDPTKTGYDFAGWWTAADGGTQITIDTMVEVTAAQTLYAHWAPTISGKIKFDETEYDSPADITAEYNGNGQTGHILEAFSDILKSDGYKISWSKNSQVVNGISKTQTITNVSDSGTWTAKLLTNEGAETGQSVTATVTVNPRSVDHDDIVIGDITDIPWVKGSGPFAPASLSVTDNGNALTEGADNDYTAAYSDNTDVTANAKATITGQNNYTGTKYKEYRIVLSIKADGTNLQDVLDYIAASNPTVSSDLVICPESITLSSEIKTTPSDATKAIISTILGKVTEGTISNFTLDVKQDGSNIAAVIGLVDAHSGVAINVPNPVTIPEGTKITVTANNKGVVNDLISKADDASKLTLVITNDNLSVAAEIFGISGVKDKNVKADTNALTIDTTDKLTAMGTILDNVNSASKPGLANNSTVEVTVLSSLTQDGKKIVKELYDSATDSTKKSAYQPYLTSTVSFDAQGGSTCTQQTVTYDNTYSTLPTTTKTGYNFVGWFTADSEGNLVTADTKVTTVEDHTLYAHWTLNNYGITVPTLAHGSVTWAIVQSNDSAPYGKTIKITVTPDTGYQLKDGSLKVYKTDDPTTEETVTDNTFTMPAYGVTITAEFEPKEYTVTFNVQGHGIAPAAEPVKFGDKVIRPSPDPSAAGLTFDGWYKEPDCINEWNFGTDTVQGDMILYAKWVHGSYTVKFDGNGGTISSGSETSKTISARYGDTIQLLKAERGGYTHTGWALTRDGPSVYTPAQNVQDLGDITLYAVWTKNQEILYEISVTVQKDDITPLSGVTVELKQGNSVLTSAKTSDGGTVAFHNVTKGIYNLVAKTAEGKIKTEEVTITDSSQSVIITIPTQGICSVVEVSAKAGTPAVVVGGADEEAVTKAEPWKFVTLTVKVEAKTPGDTANTEEKTQEEIRKIVQISGGAELQHLGLTVEKTVTDSTGSITEHKQLENTEKVLEFIIPYDFAHKNKVTVYRCHNGAAEPLTQLNSKPADYRAGQDKTFWLDMDNGRIYIYANQFSTYSIGYQRERSSGGGSQGTSTWLPTIPSVPADNIVATDVTNQYAGQKFIPVSAANLEQISAAAPSAAAWVEGVLETATAAGIPLTNSKGAKALVNTTESIAGLQTETFTQIIDVESADGSKVTSVPFKVRLSDLSAKNLTTDDVTLYHYLEEYGLWIPLETWLISTDSTYVYYEAATDGASPFGVLLKKLDAPEVQPVPTKAGKTPVPFAGVIAGLGAAAVVFAVRMRR